MSNDDMLTHHIIHFVIGNYYKLYDFLQQIYFNKKIH